jgi:hypothetical protein
MIKFNCPVCGKKLAVPKEHAGRQARCPACKQTLTILAPAGAKPEPPKQQPAPPQPSTTSAAQPGKIETPHAEPDIADALRTRLAVPSRRVRYELWIDKRMVMGLLGSIILSAGIFAPIISGPSSGGMGFSSVGLLGGAVIIGLAAASIVLTLIGHYRSLLVTGLLALGNIGYTFVDFEVKVAAGIVKNVHLSWGWGVLAAGVIMLIIAASLKD